MQNIIIDGFITNLTRYDFVDEKGKEVKGCRVEYIVQKEETENSKGFLSMKHSCYYDNYDSLKKFVGKQVELELKPLFPKDGYKLVSVENYELS